MDGTDATVVGWIGGRDAMNDQSAHRANSVPYRRSKRIGSKTRISSRISKLGFLCESAIVDCNVVIGSGMIQAWTCLLMFVTHKTPSRLHGRKGGREVYSTVLLLAIAFSHSLPQ